MEFIRSFPGFVSNREDISDVIRGTTCWARRNAAILGWAAAGGLICLLAGLWPAATVCALVAGAIVLWIGQRLRYRAAIAGEAARKIADFRMANGGLECHFHEDALRHSARLRIWRAVAAVVSAGVCAMMQHCHWMPWNLLDLVRIPHGIATAGFFCWPLLPLACCAFFFLPCGLEAHWQAKLRAAIRSRAADAVTQMMRACEIDGLESGIAALYRQCDLWWTGEYRSTIQKWIEFHTVEAIFEPETAASFVKAVTEQARTHLNCLAEAVESFRSTERRQYLLETLIRASGESQATLMERASHGMDELRSLVIAKRWEEFSSRAEEIANELDCEIMEFRLRSRSTVFLPPETDPYRILGAETSTPTTTIKKLRLRLAQVYHPDIGGETGNDMKMAEVNAAYDAVMRERACSGK